MPDNATIGQRFLDNNVAGQSSSMTQPEAAMDFMNRLGNLSGGREIIFPARQTSNTLEFHMHSLTSAMNMEDRLKDNGIEVTREVRGVDTRREPGHKIVILNTDQVTPEKATEILQQVRTKNEQHGFDFSETDGPNEVKAQAAPIIEVANNPATAQAVVPSSPSPRLGSAA